MRNKTIDLSHYKKTFLVVMIFSIALFLASFTSAIDWTKDSYSYFKFDNSLEDTLGTIENTTNYMNFTTGKINQALKIGGSEVFTYNQTITHNLEWTSSFWFKPTNAWNSATTRQDIWYDDAGADGGRIFYDLDNGKLSCYMIGSENVSYTTTFSAGTWYMISCSYDDGVLRLYLNGNNVANYTGSGGVGSGGTASKSFGGTGSQEFTVDEWSFFNRTLTASDISDLYNDGLGLPFNISLFYEYNNQNVSLTYFNSSKPAITSKTLYNYQKIGDTIYLNYTFGTTNYSAPITLASPSSLRLWFTNSSGKFYTDFDWDYKIFENSRTFNSTTFETAYESYYINVTANASLTSVKLNYNGTAYSMTQSGEIWSYSKDTPSGAGTKNVYFNFTYAGDKFISSTSNQIVNQTSLGICNASLTIPYINFTFKDESDLSFINASIQSSTWEYYLGSGTQTKSYSYANTTAHDSYGFCLLPTDRTVYTTLDMNYLSSGYPIRNYNPSTLNLTNTTTNKLLYLLSSTEGIYSTFVTTDSQSSTISGADILIYRDILGVPTIVAQGQTDGAGSFTAWLNPNYDHTVYASKTGYGTSTTTIKPTQSSYTIVLTSTTNYTYVSNTRGLLWAFFPGVGLLNGTTYNFGFNISSQYANIVGCKIELLNKNKSTVLSSNTQVATNSSLCSVFTSFTLNSTYPQIKGRLLVDLGGGYQILEEDAFWAREELNTTGMTLKDWFGGLRQFDLRYFNNNQQHREYTQILMFFLVVMIILAVANQLGWDIQTNGGMIYLVGFLVWIASVVGFLTLEGISPFSFIDKFFVAMIYSFFMIGYAARTFT